MTVSYRKLWLLLTQRKLKKNDLRKKLSAGTIHKLSHNRLVSLSVLLQICVFLHCDIGDIVEFVPKG